MNKRRRSTIRTCIQRLQGDRAFDELQQILEILECVLEEEDDSRENTPDGLDCTERYYNSENASEYLESAIEQVEDVLSLEGDCLSARKQITEAISLLNSI